MSIVNNFDDIRAELDKIEKKSALTILPEAVRWGDTIKISDGTDQSRYFWGLAGIVLRNKDTGEMIHSIPNTIYDLTIWEVYSVEGIV